MNVIRECTNPDCQFRYPDIGADHDKAFCPKCGQAALIREHMPVSSQIPLNNAKMALSRGFKVILDNIRSIYNVGSIFRTSDGFGIEELFLCGITPTPQNPRFSKTSLGAENHLQWQYHPNAVYACLDLQNKGFEIVSLEITPKSVNLYEINEDITSHPLALVIGNEKSGIDPAILRLSNHLISIPMVGHKNSYNVATSFGIAVSYIFSLSFR